LPGGFCGSSPAAVRLATGRPTPTSAGRAATSRSWRLPAPPRFPARGPAPASQPAPPL